MDSIKELINEYGLEGNPKVWRRLSNIVDNNVAAKIIGTFKADDSVKINAYNYYKYLNFSFFFK